MSSEFEKLKSQVDGAPMVPLRILVEPVSCKASRQVSDIAGVDINKSFIISRANLSESDTSKYKIVKPGHFACNLMHIGRDIKLPVAINNTVTDLYVSPAYYVFKIKDGAKILPLYLFLILSRPEFDRLTWFYTDSSVRGNLPEKVFLEIRIPLPKIDVQRRYVDAYEGLKKIAEQNEALLEPLSRACQAYLANVRKQYASVSLDNYIEPVDERNTDGKYTVDDVKGISIDKTIIETKADMAGVSLTPYKLFKPNHFCYVPITSRNGGKITLAINDRNATYIVSSSYCVFKVKDTQSLLPTFLYLILCRPEFDRYARFNSWGSAREAFGFEEMRRVRIPLPKIDVQKSIVALYKCAEEARSIAAEARETMRKLCPAMIQRASHTNE